MTDKAKELWEIAIVDLCKEIQLYAADKGQKMNMSPRDMSAALILAAAETVSHVCWINQPQDNDLSIAIELFKARFNRVRTFHTTDGASEATVN